MTLPIITDFFHIIENTESDILDFTRSVIDNDSKCIIYLDNLHSHYSLGFRLPSYPVYYKTFQNLLQILSYCRD